MRLTSTADPDLSWDGTVTRIAPEDDPATRTFAAYVQITPTQTASQTISQIGQNDHAPLAPGAFVSGVVMEAQTRPRIVVPRRSIRTQRVMLVRDDLIQTSRVSEDYAYQGPLPTLGLPDEQWAVLDSGVREGDLVVLNPTRSLSDGQPVQPVPVDQDTLPDRAASHSGSTPAVNPSRGGAK